MEAVEAAGAASPWRQQADALARPQRERGSGAAPVHRDLECPARACVNEQLARAGFGERTPVDGIVPLARPLDHQRASRLDARRGEVVRLGVEGCIAVPVESDDVGCDLSTPYV